MEDEPEEPREVPAPKICRECGGEADRLYQNDTCKPCLLGKFNKYIEIIDQYRAYQETSG